MNTVKYAAAALVLLAGTGTALAQGQDEDLGAAGPVGASTGQNVALNLAIAGGATLLTGGAIAAALLTNHSHGSNGTGTTATSTATGTTGTQ